jgi:sarcosine oxidase
MAPATDRTADVIVVGLGAAGAATLYQLARRGVNAIGLDRFTPPHDRGSSHGETRITRQGVGEGEVYAPLAIRSHEIWAELEAATGAELLDTCGLLTLAPADGRGEMHGTGDFLGRAAAVARAFDVAHEILRPTEIAARWPQFRLTGEERGLFEPGAGLVYPERCIAAQIAEARRLGARVVCDCPALAVEETAAGVRVITADGVFEGATAVVTAGAWAPGLLGGSLARLVLQPQILHWFACEEPAAFAPGRFPTFIWLHGENAADCFYGFPAVGGVQSGLKMARETRETIATPEDLDRRVPSGDAAEVFERHLSGRLRGVGPTVLRSAVCVYTTAPDSDFVAGWTGERVLAASACSGHGFKHSAAIGELLAAAVTQGRPLPSQFDPRRLETVAGASTQRGASAK